MAKVAIVIPAFNSQEFISLTLDSVMAQTYQDFEVLIVDDESTDNTKNIIESYIQKYPDKIRYFWKTNGGPAQARNVAIKESKSEYLAFVDADDIWMPTRLEEGVKILDAQLSIGLVHTNLYRMSGSGDTYTEPVRKTDLLSGHIFNDLLERRINICCSTVLIRNVCIDRVGYMDEDPQCMCAEDRDMWLRISKEFEVAYVNQFLVKYREHEAGISKNMDHVLRAMLYVFDKHRSSLSPILCRQVRAAIYTNIGDYYLYTGFPSKAVPFYGKGMLYWPFRMTYWKNLFKSLIRYKVRMDVRSFEPSGV